jgi:hypothetical protein
MSKTNLCIVGGTPAGIAAAVRAHWEGMTVTLVSYRPHLGGILTNGLGSFDGNYKGFRAPVQEEWLKMIRDHYRVTYGEDSPEYRTSQSGPFGAGRWEGMYTWEPHVAEKMFEEMLSRAAGVKVERGYYPVSVERAGRRICSVLFRSFSDGTSLRVEADTFIDTTYEADLAALAGVPYRVGREDRNEFNEIYAGKLWVHRSSNESHLGVDDEAGLKYPRAAARGELNIRPWSGTTQEILSESTGEGDDAVQAYNFRVTLSRDPANRIQVEKPAGYQREIFLPIVQREKEGEELAPIPIKSGLLNYPLTAFPAFNQLMRGKCDWNAAAIPGAVDAYPDGDWPTRDAIFKRHKDFALGLLYFLQNDPLVPEKVRRESLEWGLPKDEFADNGHFPREFYVREARRIIGRYILREQDCCMGRGLKRAPVHHDSIAIAEWLMDSHDCTPVRYPGAEGDGFTSLSEFTRPAQIPWRSFLPQDIDNLVVGLAISATHAAWGTVRVETVLMHLGEVAAVGAALAIREGISPARLSIDVLQRKLAETHVMLTFFNDFDMSSNAEWVPAVQYLGTKGFFASYWARPEEILSAAIARTWAQIVGAMIDKNVDASSHARRVAAAEDETSEQASIEMFAAALRKELDYRQVSLLPLEQLLRELDATGKSDLTRGHACLLVYRLLALVERPGRKQVL